MAHRGPDDRGSYVDDQISLGMVRLSIIDPEGGHQPISNERGDVTVVCNGEIYNFRELRQELVSQGFRFKSKSDTEVILHAYQRSDETFVGLLDGMFAFAIWDSTKRRLIIGRDRLGIKPLYYYNDGRRLIFASEAKAILEAPGVEIEIDPIALENYLALGYVPAPFSIFKGIRKLPPACTLRVEGGKVAIERYWCLPREIDQSLTEDEWADQVSQNLERAVVSQMVSDVPLGAFLSGGIDSSAIVAFMARNSAQRIKTYSIGFDTGPEGAYYNELPFARIVADRFNTEHREILVQPDVVGLMPKLIWQMDEPIADSAFITTYLVSEFARRDVKVILSGVGGDELFGGYRRYLGDFYDKYYRWIPRPIRTGILSPIARRMPADRHSPLLNFTRQARRFMLTSDLSPVERYRSYVRAFSESEISALVTNRVGEDDRIDSFALAYDDALKGDPLRTMFEVDSLTQLPDDLLMLTDRMTMAASIEGRVPLLDHQLVELAARMPARFKIRGRSLKHILKRVLGDVLPRDILYRQKRGFGAPIGAWMKRELAPMTRYFLSPESTENRGIFRASAVTRMISQHLDGREDHTDHLLALLNLEIWSRLFLDRQSPEDLSAEITASTKP